MFRCRHFINKHPTIEHFAANEKMPPDSEYYDPDLACIDRVLWIREVKNTEGHSTSDFTESMSLYEKVKLLLESPLLPYFYTPYKIYLFKQYIKGVDDLNAKRKELRESVATTHDDISDELRQYDALEEQYSQYVPEIVPIPAAQQLVLVKWNNQAYDQVTWELEEDVKHEQSKIVAFHRNNRVPDIRTLVSPFRWAWEAGVMMQRSAAASRVVQAVQDEHAAEERRGAARVPDRGRELAAVLVVPAPQLHPG